ncbi:MAG: mannosyltransferase family protein [Acidimicrobiales bacterium]
MVAYLAARLVTLVGVLVVDRFTGKGVHHVLGVWDGAWFVRAAEHGWPSHLPMAYGHVARNTIAFFPAFPLVIRALSAATPLSPLTAGLLVSGVSGLTAVLSVALLVRHYAGEDAARRGALLFALCPGTFVFSLAYSEGITITCVALGLVALLRRRWWWAGALGLVATATSPIALAFVASCAWCAVRAVARQRNWQALAAPVLAPLGFAAYMVWLWVHTGSLSAWRLTEQGGWQSYPSLAYPVHILTTFLFDPVAPTETGQILFAGTVVTVIGAVLAIRRRQPAPVLTYGLLAAALAAVTAPVGLRPRFMMLAFPLVVAIGTTVRGRAYPWLVALSACLLIAMTALELASTAVFP